MQDNGTIIFMSLVAIIIVLGFIGIAYTYYLCRKVVPRIDEIVHGHRFMFDTWLTLILRMQAYMAWSTFNEYLPRLAEKRGWTEKAVRIPRKIRRLLIINNLILAVGVLLMLVGELILYFHPEIESKFKPPSLPGENAAEPDTRPESTPFSGLPENHPVGIPCRWQNHRSAFRREPGAFPLAPPPKTTIHSEISK